MDAKTARQTAAELEDDDRDDFEDDDDEQEEMSEEDLEGFLAEAIEAFADESDEVDHVDIGTFRDHGVLTMNRGLVLRIGDSEFQITIVRSR